MGRNEGVKMIMLEEKVKVYSLKECWTIWITPFAKV
jgi:hypothetical protein